MNTGTVSPLQIDEPAASTATHRAHRPDQHGPVPAGNPCAPAAGRRDDAATTPPPASSQGQRARQSRLRVRPDGLDAERRRRSHLELRLHHAARGPEHGPDPHRAGASVPGNPRSRPHLRTSPRAGAVSQAFAVAGGSLYTVQVNYNFITNEFPSQFVDDIFRALVTSPSGTATTLARSAPTAFQTSSEGRPRSASRPRTRTRRDRLQDGEHAVGPGDDRHRHPELRRLHSGSDTIFDSAALVDAAAVGQDPPLYFLRRGDNLVRTGADPLLRLNNATQTFDSLMVVCCDGRATLAGPLLHATNSNLTVPWSLLAVMQGGALTTSSTDPLGPPGRGRLHLRRRGRADVRSLRHDRGGGSGDRPHPRDAPSPPARGLAPRGLQRHRHRRPGGARGQRAPRGERAAPGAPQRQQA